MRLFLLLFFIACSHVYANDGVFYAAGNQLIPIQETDISVSKEILTIKRNDEGIIEVTVYYVFDNPGNSKNLLVGFEAQSPSGDVDATPLNGRHPNIRNFTVQLNNEILPFDIAIVKDEVYYENDKFKTAPKEEVENIENVNYVDFYYVYHFNTTFKPGKNVLIHTYEFDESGSVMTRYEFNYVLTAARRWANEQIDDFTLILDMGDYEEFCVYNKFFESANEWLINGLGKSKAIGESNMAPSGSVQFAITKGNVQYSKKNFRPAGELYVAAFQNYLYYDGFDMSKHDVPFAIPKYIMDIEVHDEMSKKVIRNLPFARRGYIFKTKALQDYFENQYWYIPNPNYVSSIDHLTQLEKEWVEKWSK